MRLAARLTLAMAVVTALGLAMAAALPAAALSSCGSSSSGKDSLRVFAAASLTDAFQDITQAFERQHPGVNVSLQFAGSTQLATQIATGAPADVFASANQSVMQSLLSQNFGAQPDTQPSTQPSPQVFARNELVIATPADNPHDILGLADLSNPDIALAICDPSVPCGSLAAQAAAQAGVQLKPSTYESNVRAVLSKLTLGEVDAGLVYLSDLRASEIGRTIGQLTHITVSPAPLADYPAVALSDNPAAASFVDFLLTPQAQQMLSEHGFRVVR